MGGCFYVFTWIHLKGYFYYFSTWALFYHLLTSKRGWDFTFLTVLKSGSSIDIILGENNSITPNRTNVKNKNDTVYLDVRRLLNRAQGEKSGNILSTIA